MSSRSEDKFIEVLKAVRGKRQKLTGKPGDEDLADAEVRYVAFRMLGRLGLADGVTVASQGQLQKYKTELSRTMPSMCVPAATNDPEEKKVNVCVNVIVDEVDKVISALVPARKGRGI